MFGSEFEANGDFGMNRHRSRSGRRCLDETETVGRKLRWYNGKDIMRVR